MSKAVIYARVSSVGERQSTERQVADREQRNVLGMGGSDNKVTLYVLENMQGYRYTDTDAEVKDDTKTPASAWYTVYNELGASKLSKCTFLELNVLLYNNGEDTERAEHRNYRLYLSEDVGSACNFNIPRNMRKTMKIRIVDTWPPDNQDVDYFTFVDEYGREERNLPMVNPGETTKLYFKTNLQTEKVRFATTDVDSGASSDALTFSAVQNGTVNYTAGSRPLSVSGADNIFYVNVTVDPSTKVGSKLSVKGGDLSGNGAWDTKSVIVGGVVPEHIASYVGEWSGFKVSDILDEYGDVYAIVRLYDSNDEPVSYTYHSLKNNRDYVWSTVSCDGYRGLSTSYANGLVDVSIPHIFWDGTKEEFFVYAGKVDGCAYYKVEFEYIVGTDDQGDDLYRKEVYKIAPTMPVFLPGRGKSSVTYYDIGSGDNEFYFDIYDPVSKASIRNSWFEWGGLHSLKVGASGDNDYLWYLRQGRNGYTADGANTYYSELGCPYDGYLLDMFSLDIERNNIPSYIETNINYEDPAAGFDRLEFASHASALQTKETVSQDVSVRVSHPFFDNGCTFYPTWSGGSKIVVEYDDEYIYIDPVVMTTGAGNVLAVEAQSAVPCEISVQVKNVYSGKVFTFTIPNGERYSDSYVSMNGFGTIIAQGVSISPDIYVVTTTSSTHIYRQPYRIVFDDVLEYGDAYFRQHWDGKDFIYGND